jgi:hypothetical protein
MATLGNTPRPAYVYDTETDTWVPVGVGAHTHSDIPNTLVDAKGDLITATADNVPARLAKGADGTVLVADSTTSTGLAWQPYGAQVVAGKNLCINGGMDFWQRGTNSSFAGIGSGGYSADRWNSTMSGTNISWTITRDTNVPNASFTYSLKLTQTSSPATSVTEYGLRYRIEQQNAQILTGKHATISFWYKTNLTGLHYVRSNTISGVGSTESNTTFTVASADTWQYITFTSSTFLNVTSWSGTPESWGAYFDFGLSNTSVGATATTIPANAYFQVTGVQIEVGKAATPFSRTGGTIQGELAACQRYYVRLGGGALYDFVGMGNTTSTSGGYVIAQFPSHMRSIPSSIDYSNLGIAQWGTSPVAVSSASILNNGSNASNKTAVIQFAGSGFPAGGTFVNMTGNGSSGYIGFNAEL